MAQLSLWCQRVMREKRIWLPTTAANLQRTFLTVDDRMTALSHSKASSATMSRDICAAQVKDGIYSL
jgi:hypothetical protein